MFGFTLLFWAFNIKPCNTKHDLTRICASNIFFKLTRLLATFVFEFFDLARKLNGNLLKYPKRRVTDSECAHFAYSSPFPPQLHPFLRMRYVKLCGASRIYSRQRWWRHTRCYLTHTIQLVAFHHHPYSPICNMWAEWPSSSLAHVVGSCSSVVATGHKCVPRTHE